MSDLKKLKLHSERVDEWVAVTSLRAFVARLAAKKLLHDAKANADWFENNGYLTEAANIRRLIAEAEGDLKSGEK